MSQQDGGKRPQWTGRRADSGDVPDFPDERELENEIGPSRTPLQEMRDYSFFGPDDDVDAAEPEPAARPQPERAALAPTRESPTPPPVVPGESFAAARGLSEETALALIVGFFAVGGLALIVTGFLLGGFAGGLLVLVGLVTLVATGLGFWQERQGRQGRLG